MLHINDLTYRIGGRILFNATSAHVPAGQRVGLIGPNGAGKTTLFRLILGEVASDGDDISIRPRASVGTVRQEMGDIDRTVLDTVLAADTERAALLAELADIENHDQSDGHRLAEIHERLTVIDAHRAEARASGILAGLGFSTAAQARPVKEFSGGWRMRIALAAALFARPDLLLLDEPTNHLDLEATIWLEAHLAGYPGTLMVISHDRDLLNRAVSRILHLHEGRLVSYGGNYDTFERQRREKMALAAKAYEKQMAQRRHIQEFVDRFRYKASKARQAQSRLKMLERMEVTIPTVDAATPVLDFPEVARLSPPLIHIEEGVAGYGDTVVLQKLNLRLDMQDRIALLGANGNGKSTLAKVLAGRLALLDGTMRRHKKLNVGYFAQHQTEELKPAQNALDHLAVLMPMATETALRSHLGRFGFGASHVETPVAKLSGGEKARLLIALMSRAAPELLILDEPTNHLDIDTRASLITALNAYEGAVVLISHDVRLIESCADRLLLVAEGKANTFDGDMSDYRRYLLEAAKARMAAENAQASGSDAGNDLPSPSAKDRKEARREAAEARAKLAPLRKRIKQLESDMEKAETERAALQEQLADPSMYATNTSPTALPELQKKLGAVEKSLSTHEEQWLSAQSELEALEIANES